MREAMQVMQAAVGGLLALALAGCGQLPNGVPLGSPDQTVHVYVSNQSFDDPVVDLRVSIGDDVLFDGEAKVGNQHDWKLRERNMTAGTYTITALERSTATQASQEFTFAAGEQRWIVVDFWNDEQDGARFTFLVRDEQVHFS